MVGPGGGASSPGIGFEESRLQIDKQWEDEIRSEVLSKMSEKDVRKLRCVEIVLNAQLFHIDIAYNCVQKLPRLRHIVDDPRELLAVLEKYRGRTVRVSLQSPADHNGEYTIVGISKICSTINLSREIQYSFFDKNGVVHIHSFIKNPIIIAGESLLLWSGET